MWDELPSSASTRLEALFVGNMPNRLWRRARPKICVQVAPSRWALALATALGR